MKKKEAPVVGNSAVPAEVAAKTKEIAIIDEDLLKSKVYTIRGVKVMLDAVCYDLNPFWKGSTANFHRAISQNCPTIRLE